MSLRALLTPALHADVLQRYADSGAPDWECRALATRYALIPMWRDWMGFIGLAADGDLLFVAWQAPHTPVSVEEPHWRRIALAQGSAEYPELVSLRPVRPADAVTCPSCGGTGEARGPSGATFDNIVCECGGLGWIPASEAGQDRPA